MNAPWNWFRNSEKRAIATSDPRLAEFFGQAGVNAYVDPNRASGLAVAQACISVIAQNLAAMPLNTYQRKEDGGREKAAGNPLFDVLHSQFNPQMTAFEGRETLVSSLLTTGNGYARIETNGRGQVTGLFPLDSRMVSAEKLESGRLRYKITNTRGGTTTYLQDEMLHIRDRLAPDGIMGISPIQRARDTFGLALTQEDQANKQAKRAFRPEGGLVFPQSLSGQNKTDVLDRLRDRVESQATTSGVLVLDGGAEWRPFAMSSKDAEFLESRKLTQLDIARIYSVPPTVVGITDNATYSNVDGESKALVVRCLAPMARRIEQAMNVALLSTAGRRTMFIEHDLAGLLRGDQKARFEAYRIGREWGWLSQNEIRQLENMSKIKGGDIYLSPLNMAPTGEGGDDDGT